MTKPEFSQLPVFFIIGRPRSGTSLLMTVLDANPHVIIPPEIPIIPLLRSKYQNVKIWDKKQLEEFYNDLCKLKFGKFYKFSDLPFNTESIKNKILSSSANVTFAELIRIIYSNYRSIFPKNNILILGDKNPAYSKEALNYLKIFPDAKFIHIRKDYRDHALSMLRAGFGIKNLAFIAFRWKSNMKATYKLIIKHPEKVLMIKFENFVSEPTLYLKKICEFLSIPFYTEMLNYHHIVKLDGLYPKSVMSQYQSSLLKPINQEAVGLWKNKMTEQQIKLCDFVVGDQAELFGYERKFKGFYLKGAIILGLIIFRKAILFLLTKSLYFLPTNTKFFLRKNFSFMKKIFNNLES